MKVQTLKCVRLFWRRGRVAQADFEFHAECLELLLPQPPPSQCIPGFLQWKANPVLMRVRQALCQLGQALCQLGQALCQLSSSSNHQNEKKF